MGKETLRRSQENSDEEKKTGGLIKKMEFQQDFAKNLFIWR